MELRKYLAILWRRKWVILITMTVTVVVVIAGTLVTKPTYSASSMLRIATSSNISASSSDYQYADRLMNTYVTISTSKVVLDELKQQLGLSVLPPIAVNTIPNTELIQITVNDRDPVQAAKVANTLGDILINQSSGLYTGGGQSSVDILNAQLTEMDNEVNQARQGYTDLVSKNPGDTEKIQAAKQSLDLKQSIYATMLSQYEQARLREAVREKSISVVQPAFDPVKPSKPNKMLNIALGFVIGGIAGLGLAFLFENLDSTLYTAEQIESSTNLHSLGSIPNARLQTQLVSTNGSNPYGDAFRRLRTNLSTLDFGVPLHTLLVTSSEPGEGKSTIATNLATALAKSGQKVIVVDCDMRLPNLHKMYSLPNDKGLSTLLIQNIELQNVIQKSVIPGITVLTSGPTPSSPAELLASPKMSGLIRQLQQSFDTVIFDTPSILEVTDAAVLAPKVDGVILVVRQASSHRETVEEACKQLVDVKARTIGVVINRAERDNTYYYYNPKKTPPRK
jgi:polysaccharide biosynthesis transport protein